MRYTVAVMIEGASRPLTGEVEAGNRAGAWSAFRARYRFDTTKVRLWKAWAVDEDGTPKDVSWSEVGAPA